MDLIVDLDDRNIESAFGKEFVKSGLCKDFSLGYNVQMSKSDSGFLQATNKKIIEVSLVKTGARENCHIRAWKA